jgi:hypothetical protein
MRSGLTPLILGAAEAEEVLQTVYLTVLDGRARAPTDVLLRTPGSELLGAMPALGASVLDTMIPTPSKRGT